MHSCVCVCVCVVLCIWLISSLALWLPQSKYSYNHKTLLSPLHNHIHSLHLPIKCWHPLAHKLLYKYLFYKCYIHGILPHVSFWKWLFYTSIQSLSHVGSLRPHGLQHARLPCPSPTPRVYINSFTLSWWCHPTISSSVVPFTSNLQSFPASESFPMSQLFASGGQHIGVSASTSVLMNTQNWFPLGWTGWISLQSKGLSNLLQHYNWKASIFRCSALLMVQLSHPYMTVGKILALTRWTFVSNVVSLLLNTLSS